MPVIDFGWGVKKTFEGPAELKAWVAREQSAWSFLPHQEHGQAIQVARNGIDRTLDALPEETDEWPQKVANHLKTWREKHSIPSESEEGRLVLRIREAETDLAAVTAYKLIVGGKVGAFSEDHFSGALQATLFLRGVMWDQEAAAEVSERMRASLVEIDAELSQARETRVDLEALFQEEIEELHESVKLHIKTVTEAVEKHKLAVGEALAKEAAVSFWTARSDMAKNRARALMAVLVLLLSLVLWGLGSAARDLLPKTASDVVHWREAFVFLLVAGPVLWFVRLVGRLYTSNVETAEDAAERVVMAQTYLAMLKEGSFDESLRHLILASLFRPSARKLGEKDGEGDWLSLITNAFSKK